MAQPSVSQQFPLARMHWVLPAFYAAAFVLAALARWLTADSQGERINLALSALALGAAALWVSLLLVRPKPVHFPARSRVTCLEYMLASAWLACAGLLVLHPGWQLASQPPSGFMAIVWGISWLASLLGPVVLAFLLACLAHWLLLQWYLDYRQACWIALETRQLKALSGALEAQLVSLNAERDTLHLGNKDAAYTATKLAHWLTYRRHRPFSLELAASGYSISASPIDAGDAKKDNAAAPIQRTAFIGAFDITLSQAQVADVQLTLHVA